MVVTPLLSEDAEIASKETSPLLHSISRSPTFQINTPSSLKDSGLLKIPRIRHRPTKDIGEDIWDELHDTELNPSSKSPLHAQFAPSPPSRSRAQSLSSAAKFDSTYQRDSPGVLDSPSLSTEETPLLHRSSTGRSYRDTRRRRSMPVSPLDLQSHRERERRRRSVSSQEALGGWWKMQWWKDVRERRESRKGKERNRGKEGQHKGQDDGSREDPSSSADV